MAIHYGREAELPGVDREAQEISMLALHLLQSALVLVNTDRIHGSTQLGMVPIVAGQGPEPTPVEQR